MKRERLTSSLAYLAAVAAVASALAGAGAARAQSQTGGRQKVSADLRQKLSTSSKVNVVIKAAGAWSQALDDAVRRSRGTVTRSFDNFPLRAATLPAGAVGALALRPDVDYVALDREVKLLGHVSLTTGAGAARVMANYSPVYEGQGAGIAVLDSGLDPAHVAMTVESGMASRVVFSKDFTGENRTDDPYGHGTHVASIAGFQFTWAQGLVLDQTFATGTNLVTKYQDVYGLGVLLSDGSMMADGSLLADTSAQATLALVRGDQTTSMPRVAESWLPPTAPSVLRAAAVSRTQINPTWADNSTDETGFRVERSADGVSFDHVGTVGADVRSFASTGLSAARKYYFRVSAYNANGGSAYTSVASAKTQR